MWASILSIASDIGCNAAAAKRCFRVDTSVITHDLTERDGD
jgi:hypothetical protein